MTKPLFDTHPMRAAMLSMRLQGHTIREIAELFGVNESSLKQWLRRVVAKAQDMGTTDAAEAIAATEAEDLPAAAETATETFRLAFGQDPMAPHQTEILDGTGDLLLLKGRQVGASSAVAGLALHVAQAHPFSLSAVVSPSMRQASEVLLRSRQGAYALGLKLDQDSAMTIRLKNGSRIVSIGGGRSRALRGYSITGGGVLVLDEAAYLPDEVFEAAYPLAAATGARTIVMSTPGEPQGEFHRLVTDEVDDRWVRLRVTSEQVPTIAPEFLEKQRKRMRPDKYRREFLAEFATDETRVRLWTREDLEALMIPADQIPVEELAR